MAAQTALAKAVTKDKHLAARWVSSKAEQSAGMKVLVKVATMVEMWALL